MISSNTALIHVYALNEMSLRIRISQVVFFSAKCWKYCLPNFTGCRCLRNSPHRVSHQLLSVCIVYIITLATCFVTSVLAWVLFVPSPFPKPPPEKTAESVYAGPGAGRYPTANSVVNDIVRLARLGPAGTSPPFPLEQSWELQPDFESCFCVRLAVGSAEADKFHVLVGDLAEKAGVTIMSVQRAPPVGDSRAAEASADFALMTRTCKRSQIVVLLESLKGQPWLNGEPVLMSVLEAE